VTSTIVIGAITVAQAVEVTLAAKVEAEYVPAVVKAAPAINNNFVFKIGLSN